MPSPFPGMDPYLENPAFWRDFHQRFITYWSDILNDLLPDHYEARIDERIGLASKSGREGACYPDVDVSRTYPLPSRVPTEPQALETEPVGVKYLVQEQVEEAFLRLWHRPNRTLVAVMELLSPTNKEGAERSDYLRKRAALLAQPIHVVELDLLLGGQRLPTSDPLPPGDYYALVSPAENRPVSEVYACGIRQRLPRIRIPLLPPDPPILLDVQEVFTIAYDRGRYRRALGYRDPLPVPVSEVDARWIEELLRPLRTVS